MFYVLVFLTFLIPTRTSSLNYRQHHYNFLIHCYLSKTFSGESTLLNPVPLLHPYRIDQVFRETDNSVCKTFIQSL